MLTFNLVACEKSSIKNVLFSYSGIPLTSMHFFIAESKFFISVHYEVLLYFLGEDEELSPKPIGVVNFEINVGYDIYNHVPTDVLFNCREQISSRNSIVNIDSLTRYKGLVVC